MNLLYPLDDDEFSLLETLSHDDIAALFDARRDSPLLDLFVRTNHHHIAAGLIELHG
jgi:hypothetical protein